MYARRPARNRIVGEAGVIGGLHEAGKEAGAQILIGSLAGVDPKHRRVAAQRLRVPRRTTEHFRPVVGKPRDVVRVARMGEGVTQHRILETASVVGGRERRESRLTSRVLEHGSSRHVSDVSFDPHAPSRKGITAAASAGTTLMS